MIITNITDFVSPAGDLYRDVLTPDIGKDGQIKLVVTGRESLQDLYNSFVDSCEPSIIIQRFLDSGDPTLIQRGNPQFLDLLGAPKSLAEAYSINFRAEAAFNGLPLDVRQQFDNNFLKFLEAAGSEDWFSRLKMSNPNDITIPKEDDNESKQ